MSAAALERALAYPYDRAPLAEAPDAGAGDRADALPLLAYGANASPARLADKLGAAAPPPATPAVLHDHDVVYSAHVTAYGAIPATLRRSPGTTVEVTALWLDEAALARLHPTEARNYAFGTLRGIDLRLADGRRLNAARAYRSRHGCVRIGSEAVALAAVPARGRRAPALEQGDLIEHARGLLRRHRDIEGFVVGCVEDPALRALGTQRLRAAALPDGLCSFEDEPC